ncbi:MAG: fumarate hydratase, partial [bacterium]
VSELCRQAAFYIPQDVLKALDQAYKNETSETGRDIIQCIIENDRIAAKENIPICQDTGLVVVFIRLGQELHVEGGDLYEAVNEGVRRAYTDNYLRKSIVRDPLDRINTGDNTPAIIHCDVVPGSKLHIIIAPKGGGSENMSAIKMLPPSAGIEGVKEFVIQTVKQAGANPCPPIIVGVGMGANFEGCAYLAKKSLMRTIGSVHPDPDYAKLEQEMLREINNLDIGPQGFGGKNTALALYIENAPCHITSIPVAVNIQCHAARHAEGVL